MKTFVLTVFAVFGLFLFSCNSSHSTNEPSPGSGIARLKFTFDENSTFSAIAHKAVIIVSGKDFEEKTFPLSITDSSVEGLIENIAAGQDRYFEISVYDSLEVLQYQGSVYSEVIANATTELTIEIKRVIKSGNVIITGVIDEALPDTAKGLVAYYPFNGNAEDESGNNFNGTVKGATLTRDRFGDDDKAYFFDGNTGILATLSKQISTYCFTLTAWFKHNGRESERVPRIVAVAKPGSCFGYHELLFANGYWRGGSIDYSGKLMCYISNASARDGYDIYYSENSADTSAWHHGAVTFEDSILTYYFDGAVDTTIKVSGVDRVLSNEAEIQIGFSTGNPNCGFNGSLDEIRIYNYSLTEDEIKTLFNKED